MLQIDIMPSRCFKSLEAFAGFEKTGMPFLGYDGQSLYAAGYGDDIGIYYFVPKIAHLFNISMNQSVTLFLAGSLALSAILGAIGIFLLFKSWVSRFVSFIALCGLVLVSYEVGDVYVIGTSVILAIIPLFLYFLHRFKINWMFIAFMLMAGMSITLANYVRSQTGNVVLVFILLMVAFHLRLPLRAKMKLLIPLALGILIPVLIFTNALNSRDAFLAKNDPNYEAAPRQHIVWHSVYIGMGFLSNEYGIEYRDEVAIEKVRSISPTAAYLSREYEGVLKQEVIKLILNDPLFAVMTLFSKIGVISLYILFSANVGLVLSFYYRKSRSLEFAFWSAMAFSSLFGILVVPLPYYAISLVALATVYGLVSINSAIEKGVLGDTAALFSRVGGRLKSAA